MKKTEHDEHRTSPCCKLRWKKYLFEDGEVQMKVMYRRALNNRLSGNKPVISGLFSKAANELKIEGFGKSVDLKPLILFNAPPLPR